MKLKSLIIMGAIILGGLPGATNVFASDSRNGNELQPIACNVNHTHEDCYCISLEVQEYWNAEQIKTYNTVMKERNKYIKYLKSQGYKDKNLLNAIEGYDSSLRWTEDIFTRDLFEAKDSDIKIEEK